MHVSLYREQGVSYLDRSIDIRAMNGPGAPVFRLVMELDRAVPEFTLSNENADTHPYTYTYTYIYIYIHMHRNIDRKKVASIERDTLWRRSLTQNARVSVNDHAIGNDEATSFRTRHTHIYIWCRHSFCLVARTVTRSSRDTPWIVTDMICATNRRMSIDGWSAMTCNRSRRPA